MSATTAQVIAIEQRLRRARVVPVLRVGDPAAARTLIDRLLGAELDVLELTTTIPGWPEVAAALRDESPEVCIGIGTVTSPEQARRAVAMGADFCVSPRLVPDARRVLDEACVPFIEGGLTPTEVLGATAAGGIAKLFPAHVGGVGYLASLLAVAPDARIMPTGGIALTDVAGWLRAGAVAVGVGSDLTATGDIAARVREALEQ
jgi:2-dehydro-3-deoxyphosphogluconate aldolase/(4S)-4-hydroxy-2-oxoglutarate aldolase